jgi:hypothetical protein
MGVFSPLRRRLSGLTRWKKPRRAIVGPAALDGTDEVVTRGSAAEARFAVGAVETSCARFRTGSAGNLTTSPFAGGTVTFVGAAFGTWTAGSGLATVAGAGFGGLVGGSALVALAILVTFVTADLGGFTLGAGCANSFVAACRAGGLSSCSSCRTVATRASEFSGGGLNARYSRYFSSANWRSFRYWCDTIAKFRRAGR